MIDKIIVHCSATPNGRHHTAEDIHRWHLERGWSGIGYHYVICIDGTIEQGRPHYWQGAHASGHNENSIGICLIGTDEYTDEQMMSLGAVVQSLSNLHKVKKENIIGHNEVSNKTCPGFDVQEWVENEY